MLVSYIAMEKKYQVVQIVNDRPVLTGEVRPRRGCGGSDRAAHPRARSRRSRRSRKFYYRVTLDVSILQLSDLDEVNRWLKGELEPAIHGKRDPGTAITRSIRMLASRLLGGETREFEAGTDAFEVH